MDDFRNDWIDLIFDWKGNRTFLDLVNETKDTDNKVFEEEDYKRIDKELDGLYESIGPLTEEEKGMKRWIYFYEIKLDEDFHLFSHGHKTLAESVKAAKEESEKWNKDVWDYPYSIRYFKKEYTLCR